MLNLNEEQIKFLKDELGLSEESLERIEKKEWFEIRERCFEISVEELVDESGVAVDFVTKRCDTAESIADLKYSELFA